MPGNNRDDDGFAFGGRERLFYIFGRIGFHPDVSRLRDGAFIFAEIESRDREWPLGNPTGDLFVFVSVRRFFFDSFSGGDQCPAGWVVKFQIKVRHRRTLVGIPGAARADINQPSACVGEYLAPVDEVQRYLLSRFKADGSTTAI